MEQKDGEGKSYESGTHSSGLEPSQISVPGADLILHKGEITVHLVPEGRLGQAAVGMDGVNLCHF